MPRYRIRLGRTRELLRGGGPALRPMSGIGAVQHVTGAKYPVVLSADGMRQQWTGADTDDTYMYVCANQISTRHGDVSRAIGP